MGFVETTAGRSLRPGPCTGGGSLRPEGPDVWAAAPPGSNAPASAGHVRAGKARPRRDEREQLHPFGLLPAWSGARCAQHEARKSADAAVDCQAFLIFEVASQLLRACSAALVL